MTRGFDKVLRFIYDQAAQIINNCGKFDFFSGYYQLKMKLFKGIIRVENNDFPIKL